METASSIVRKLSIRTGFVMAAFLIAYFLLMKVFGLVEVVELRFLNFFILMAGIIYALHTLKVGLKHEVDYFEGMALGFFSTIISVFVFSAFVFVYLAYLDPALMLHIKEVSPFGEFLTPSAAAGVILLEGGSSGAIITFVGMQYYKNSAYHAHHHHHPHHSH